MGVSIIQKSSNSFFVKEIYNKINLSCQILLFYLTCYYLTFGYQRTSCTLSYLYNCTSPSHWPNTILGSSQVRSVSFFLYLPSAQYSEPSLHTVWLQLWKSAMPTGSWQGTIVRMTVRVNIFSFSVSKRVLNLLLIHNIRISYISLLVLWKTEQQPRLV